MSTATNGRLVSPLPDPLPRGERETWRAVFGLVLTLLAGCGPVDLYVVDVSDGGSFQGPMGRSCAQNEECLAGQLCDKASCSDALGRCVPRPPASFCRGEFRPECGCDGVTYWNDCLRRSAGVASHEPGPCLAARTCDLSSPCPEGAYCARLVFPTECGPLAGGVCYVLPDTCEQFPPEHFFACGDSTNRCLDACTAIRSEQPARRFRGPCP